MAQNTQEMAGVLLVQNRTPLIRALFEPFITGDEGGFVPGGDCGFTIGSRESVQWSEVIDSVANYLVANGREVDWLKEYEQDEQIVLLLNIVADILGDSRAGGAFRFPPGCILTDEKVSLSVLFWIAKKLDDGHGIKSIDTGGALTCLKLRPGEFGGYIDHISDQLEITQSTFVSTMKANAIERAITLGDAGKAAATLYSIAFDWIDGIHDAAFREAVLSSLIDRLSLELEPAAVPAPGA